MEKGKTRKLLELVIEFIARHKVFMVVEAGPPRFPFTAASKLPAVFVSLAPFDTKDETSLDRQRDQRLYITTILSEIENIDLRKADYIDEIEEAIVQMRSDARFLTEFANIRLYVDPTVAAITPFGVSPADIVPPFGAVRCDLTVDMHYVGVTE